MGALRSPTSGIPGLLADGAEHLLGQTDKHKEKMLEALLSEKIGKMSLQKGKAGLGLGKTGAKKIPYATVSFSQGIKKFANGTMKSGEMFLIKAKGKLKDIVGIEDVVLRQKTLKTKLQKHNLSLKDIEGLETAMQKPLMIYESGTKHKTTLVITPLKKGANRVAVALKRIRWEILRLQKLEVSTGKTEKDLLKNIITKKLMEFHLLTKKDLLCG